MKTHRQLIAKFALHMPIDMGRSMHCVRFLEAWAISKFFFLNL